MPWLLVDIVVPLVAIAALIAIGFALYRHAKTLVTSMGSASERLADAAPPPVEARHDVG